MALQFCVSLFSAADSVESRLRDLMLAAHEHRAEDELTEALQCKDISASDEKALNETVVRLFNQCDIATLVGNVNDHEIERAFVALSEEDIEEIFLEEEEWVKF
jgi:hypothetical protein